MCIISCRKKRVWGKDTANVTFIATHVGGSPLWGMKNPLHCPVWPKVKGMGLTIDMCIRPIGADLPIFCSFCFKGGYDHPRA